MGSIIGSGQYRYRVDDTWAAADAASRGELSGVACDRRGRVYLCSRRPQPKVLVYEADGTAVGSWGQDVFAHVDGPHGISVAAEDAVYVTDIHAHVVYHFTTAGVLVRTIGTPGSPGQAGQPFNMPTKAVVGPDGDLYVADGYGQNRVHRFSPSGELLASWGSPGDGPGQFDLPHSIGVDARGQVWVADRENGRAQVFDTAGAFLRQHRLAHANNVAIDDEQNVYIGADILDADGNILAHCEDYWGHSVSVAPNGDLYWTHVAAPNRLRKYVRVREA